MGVGELTPDLPIKKLETTSYIYNVRTIQQEEAYLKAAAREVRRLCHLAFAFIRQDVREAHYGYVCRPIEASK